MTASGNGRKTKPAERFTSILFWNFLVLLGFSGLGCVVAPTPSMAQGKSAEHGHGQHAEERASNKHRQAHGQSSVAFGSRDIGLIRAYYGSHREGLPPGLAKRGGNLPPGLEKHLERNGTLPPGLQKRLSPLPYNLERELLPLPSGCECHRGVLGSNVLIVNTRTGRIVDILRGIISR